MSANKMTQKQERFCLAFIQSGNASEAYRQAYPKSKKWKDSAVNVNASKTMTITKVLLRVEELREQAAAKAITTKQDKAAWLKEVVERSLQHEPVIDSDGNETGIYKFAAADVIRAIAEMNKMEGHYEPIKSDVNVKVKLSLKELMQQVPNE